MERLQTIIIGLVTLGCVCAMCAAGAYSCSQMNERYYDGMKTCLSQGGSWVPQSSETYSSSCINPHSTR